MGAGPRTVATAALIAVVCAGVSSARADTTGDAKRRDPSDPAGKRSEPGRDPDPCRAGPPGRQFPICFDPGNRLVIQAGTDGVGGELARRHTVRTEDPGITWRFEHVILRSRHDGDVTRVTVYDVRTLRHSRDGHLVLPTSPPTKLFVPFDIGFEMTVASLTAVRDEPAARLGMVRVALVAELSRSGGVRRRLSLGAAARWDVTVDRMSTSIDDQQVAPFSIAELAGSIESRDGLLVLSAAAHAGVIWSRADDWRPALAARAGGERVLVGLNDLPLSIYAEVSWSDREALRGTIGVRLALFGRHSL